MTAHSASGGTSSATSPRLVQGIGGYVLSGRGKLLPFGATDMRPHPSRTSRSDVFRGVVIRADRTGGFTVMKDGSVHPFAIGTNRMPGAPGFERLKGDLARGIVLRTPSSGYVLDAFGLLHPFGGAPAAHPSRTWPGQLRAADVVMLPGARGGYVLDVNGGAYPFSVGRHPMPRALKTARTRVPAVAIGLRADGRSGWVLTNDGVLRPFGGAPSVRSNGVAGDADAIAIVVGTETGGYWIDRNSRFHTWGEGWGNPARTRMSPARGVS